MDPARFDALARSLLTDNPSRRALLRTFAGGLAAAGLATAAAADAQPKKKKKCKPGLTRCRKKCVDLDTDPNNCGDCKNACAFEIDCVGGQCQCRDVGADCGTAGQCCSGKCSIIAPLTCRNENCKDTGACASDLDCCDGICFQGCCEGVC